MKRFILPVLLGVGILGLLVAWMNPSPFRRIEFVSEVDGERETWMVWFERWPIHHAERIPNLHVTDDFRAALRRSRIRLSASLEKAMVPVIRSRYPDRTEYWLSQNPPLLSKGGIAFFGGQLSHSRTLHGRTTARLEGVCPDGRTRLRYQVDVGPAPKHEALALIIPENETRPVASP